jgi:hypothetical protein
VASWSNKTNLYKMQRKFNPIYIKNKNTVEKVIMVMETTTYPKSLRKLEQEIKVLLEALHASIGTKSVPIVLKNHRSRRSWKVILAGVKVVTVALVN